METTYGRKIDMKIYFEDGALLKNSALPIAPHARIHAEDGVSANIRALEWYHGYGEKIVIYTNSIMAFDNRYAWNEIEQVPEIYIRAGEYQVFTRIDKLTERELRRAHNLSKMYLSGEFQTIKEAET